MCREKFRLCHNSDHWTWKDELHMLQRSDYPYLWWPIVQDCLVLLTSGREFSSWSHALACCTRVSMDSPAPLLEGVGPAARCACSPEASCGAAGSAGRPRPHLRSSCTCSSCVLPPRPWWSSQKALGPVWHNRKSECLEAVFGLAWWRGGNRLLALWGGTGFLPVCLHSTVTATGSYNSLCSI